MPKLHAALDVDAPADHVWRVLMDFPSYPEWNPFVVRLDGEARQGASLRAGMVVGGREVPADVRVHKVAAPREFAWTGGFRFRFLLNAIHWFRIEPIDGRRCRFVQDEEIRGLLAPLMIWRMGPDIGRQFVAMNEAIKRRAEGTQTGRGA